MKVYNFSKKRVRLISFSIFIFLGIIGFAYSQYTMANRYRKDLEYSYVRALNELSDYISNLEMTLNKGIYANTVTQQQGLANKIMTQSMGAKSALEQLPINYDEVSNINKFISQTSEYANYLSGNALRGTAMSSEEMENLKKLGNYAKAVNNDLKNLLEKVNSDSKNVSNFFSKETLSSSKGDSTVLKTGFKEMNDGFSDYPTLIYDGPFSDHIIRMKSKFLENQAEISSEGAKNKILDVLNLKGEQVNYLSDSDIDGNLPCYRFNSSLGEIQVTKKGGYIKSVINNRDVSDLKLDFEDAKRSAESFMKQLGYESLKESYYIINDGVCTINYAFFKDNVIYYKDLIKIGIALDTGNVVFFDATGYLMNHIDRGVINEFKNLEKAKGNVSKRLTINKINKAFIPTSGQNEVACFEFECTGESGEKVLVYINEKTGLEEQIYIIIDSDNGTLVM